MQQEDTPRNMKLVTTVLGHGREEPHNYRSGVRDTRLHYHCVKSSKPSYLSSDGSSSITQTVQLMRVTRKERGNLGRRAHKKLHHRPLYENQIFDDVNPRPIGGK